MKAFEVNFDGIVGPSHNYAGLSFGNVASTSHGQQTSNPRAAAMQGLEKMLYVHKLGVRQAVLPPLLRPRLDILRSIGFAGSDQDVIANAWKHSPQLLAACYSASNMWTANAATVSPSADCGDSKIHLTPANLNNSLHRAIEAQSTTGILRAIFPPGIFVVHDPLPSCTSFSDEGAANHCRLCHDYGDRGIELFVFGRKALEKSSEAIVPQQFPARQTYEASQAVARLHALRDCDVMYMQQNPQAIDAGVFHNDVVSVANRNVLLTHEQAFVNQADRAREVQQRFESTCMDRLFYIEFTETELSLSDAVKSYLFNSQLLSRPDEGMTLLCPMECQENSQAFQCTQRLLAESNPVDQVDFMDLRQSMNNGGGPACLRLRVVMNEAQWAATHPGVLFDLDLYGQLRQWVETHYRDRLAPEDLADPQLQNEIRTALDELEGILDLPAGILGA